MIHYLHAMTYTCIMSFILSLKSGAASSVCFGDLSWHQSLSLHVGTGTTSTTRLWWPQMTSLIQSQIKEGKSGHCAIMLYFFIFSLPGDDLHLFLLHRCYMIKGRLQYAPRPLPT